MLLKLKLDKKTYTATSIMSAISREAFQVNRDALELAKIGDQVQNAAAEGDYDKLAEFMDKAIEIKDRKATLICKVYGNKFSIDELMDNVTDAEIDLQINAIISNINGVIAKK
jgi:formyltetrahydrofolate hydrolase